MEIHVTNMVGGFRQFGSSLDLLPPVSDWGPAVFQKRHGQELMQKYSLGQVFETVGFVWHRATDVCSGEHRNTRARASSEPDIPFSKRVYLEPSVDRFNKWFSITYKSRGLYIYTPIKCWRNVQISP